MKTQLSNGLSRRAGFLVRRRGMALLLVMIGLVVCTVLTAGFLATQGTSIGIARNERDAAKSHAIAQTGIDMCYWLIRNKPDWRETMLPGDWLIGAPVGDGTVTVHVDDDNHDFADDPAAPVTLTSTGAFDNRAFALAATIRPTGGGTVFQNGNFVTGAIALGNTDLTTIATIDSYNSNTAPYNSASPGTNALFCSNAVANASLTVYYPSVFRGSYTAGRNAVLANVVNLVGAAAGPSALNVATEARNPGTVIFPNTAGLAPCPTAVCGSSQTKTLLTAGIYDDISANNGTIYIGANGTYYINNNLNSGGGMSSLISVNNNINATIVVHGDVTVSSGKISVGTNATLTLYAMGNITLTNGSINSTGPTSRLTIYGGADAKTISISGTNGILSGAIYAPAHDMIMQTNSPKFYGAAMVKSLTMKNTAAFHFDEALRALKLSNITGGSAPSGTADYRIAVTGGPGIGQ
jgi:hypothetical protein